MHFCMIDKICDKGSYRGLKAKGLNSIIIS